MRESESRRRCDARNDNSFHHDVKFNRSGLSSVVFFIFSCYKFHAIKIIVYWLHEITLDKISVFFLFVIFSLSMIFEGEEISLLLCLIFSLDNSFLLYLSLMII